MSEWSVDTIASNMESLQKSVELLREKVESLEDKINKLFEWRSAQDYRWQERDKMNGKVNSNIDSLATTVADLHDQLLKICAAAETEKKLAAIELRKRDLIITAVATLSMIGTLIVQIIVATR